ncbi:MAG: sugar-binding protein [Clostridia bacterium]|nr:sugar-binding protein [Clostridia bacterium]
MKKHMTWISIFLILLISLTNVSAQTVYFRKGFSEQEVIPYAEDAIILRAGNNECYAYNLRKSLSDLNKSLVAYIQDNKMYAPVQFILEQLGFSNIENQGEVIYAKYKEQEYRFGISDSAVSCEINNGILCGDIESIASHIGMGYLLIDDVAIISPKMSADTEIPENVLNIIKERLNYRWDNVYLGSLGYVTGMIVHPKNPELLYCRTDVGGMYRFDRANNRWIQLLHTLPYEDCNLAGVRSIAIDPNDDRILYAACGSSPDNEPCDILKSTDRGENWVRMEFNKSFGGNKTEARLSGECLVVDPNDSNTIFCGTFYEGLWVSHDAGISWEQIDTVPKESKVAGGISFVYIDSGKTNEDGRSTTIYAAAWGEGVYVSNDGGRSFTLIPDSPKIANRMEMVGNKIYMSATNVKDSTEYTGGFFIYEKGKWRDITPVHDGFISATNAFLIDRNNPNYILLNAAPYRQTNFFRSYDGGETWEYVTNLRNAPCMLQDPYDEDGFWYPYGGGIYYFSDMYANATDFVPVSRDTGVEELCGEQVLSSPAQEAPLLLSQVMDWGMMMNKSRLDVKAEIVKPQIGEGSGIDFCESDPSLVFHVGLIGRVDVSTGFASVSTDYGNTFTRLPWNTWRVIDGAVSATKQENGYPILMMLSATTTGTAKVTDQDREKSGLYRSLDFGQTWEKMNDIDSYSTNSWHFDDFRLASDRVDGNTFYYTHNNDFYVTTDGGDTWAKKYTFPISTSDPFIKAIPGVEGGVWYRHNACIYVSYDKGETWSTLETVEKPIAFGFGIGNPKSTVPAAYVAGYVDGICGVFMSDDLGKSWKRINDDSFNLGNDAVDVCGDRIMYGRVFVSTAGNGVLYGQPILMDDFPPVISLDMESSDEERSPEYAVNTKEFIISGAVNEMAEVKINGESVAVDGYNRFAYSVILQEGENRFLVEAQDPSGNFAEPEELMIRYLPNYLGVEYTTDTELITKDGQISITGRTVVPAEIFMADTSVRTDENNRFTLNYTISEDKDFNVYAVDDKGVRSEPVTFHTIYDTQVPVLTIDEIPSVTERSSYILQGTISEPGEVRVNGKTVTVKDDLSFFTPIKLEKGVNSVRVQARDLAKNATKPEIISLVYKPKASISTATLSSTPKADNFVFDGNVDEWDLSNYCEKVMIGSCNNVMMFNTMWDENYLYVAIKCIDDVVYNAKNSTDDDCLEIYIDGGNEKKKTYDGNDKQLLYPVENKTINENYIYTINEDGYCAEVRIPWSDFGVIAKSGVSIGFDIDVVDNDGLYEDGKRSGVLGWNGTGDNWKDTSSFATLTLN